jgi:hypothetical protein
MAGGNLQFTDKNKGSRRREGKIYQKIMKKILLLCCVFFTAMVLSQEIRWLDKVTELSGPGKYARMVLMKQGPKAGQLLLTYQTFPHGRNIVKRYSSDGGKTWSDAVSILKKNTEWTYANCNIIELKDGRLLMTYQRRADSNEYTGRDRYVCVKFSVDGGDTWTAEQVVFQGGNWEPMPIEIPTGIYIFFTLQDIYDTSLPEEQCLQSNAAGGRAVAFVASFDNGATWDKFSSERYGARMLLRDYNEDSGNLSGSGGGMPTPFLTNSNRLGFIAESIDRKTSPWIVVAPAGDHTFQSEAFCGSWQTVNYDGRGDNSVYPSTPDARWALTSRHWGGAPFALKLSSGKIAFSYNSGKKIYCWVADENAKNPMEVARPFLDDSEDRYSFYSSMISLNDSILLIAAHETSPGEDMARLFFRQGIIKDYAVSSDLKTPSVNEYTVYISGKQLIVDRLKGNENIRIYSTTGCLLLSEQATGSQISCTIPSAGIYLISIRNEKGVIISRKCYFTGIDY